MATIIEYREIPLDDLIIDQGQVRTENIGKGIDELAASIAAQGLLQPIVVCHARLERGEGKWEILTGQRRFLAHRALKKETITAAVLSNRVDEAEAKTISITENLMRRQLSSKELKDGILHLYNIYGSAKDVHSATGLPLTQIRSYVKYPRLVPELKDLVDRQEVDINAALKAQDASNDENGMPVPENAIKLAREMNTMSGVQIKKTIEGMKMDPHKPIDDVIEDSKSSARVTQVVVTVSQETHSAIRDFAAEENLNQDEATASLIEEALVVRGKLGG